VPVIGRGDGRAGAVTKHRDTWEGVVLDESFVAGAEHREASAEDRARWARRTRRVVRKSARRSARRTRRQQRRERVARYKTLLVVVGLVGVALAWSRIGRPDGPTLAADAAPTSVRVIYALPADAALDEAIIPAVRHELGIVQRWFEDQTGGKHIRLVGDGDAVPVEVRDLKVTAADLRNRPDAASLVDEELRPKTSTTTGPGAGEILLSFVPVTFSEQVRCGTASQTGYAIIWMGSCGAMPSADSGTFGDGATFVLAHELLHALGAVEPCAPHYGRNGHVTDDPHDVLYDGSAPSPDPASVAIDPGHDDYYRTDSPDCYDVADHPAWAD
jgi:hypothetical protein